MRRRFDQTLSHIAQGVDRTAMVYCDIDAGGEERWMLAVAEEAFMFLGGSRDSALEALVRLLDAGPPFESNLTP